MVLHRIAHSYLWDLLDNWGTVTPSMSRQSGTGTHGVWILVIQAVRDEQTVLAAPRGLLPLQVLVRVLGNLVEFMR